MTQSTTVVSAINCIVKLDNAAGTPVDISGSSNKAEIKLPHGVGEYRTFGTQWKGRVVIGKDAEVSFSFVYSTAASEARDLLVGWWSGGDDSPRSLTIDIPDGDPGSERYSGEMVLSDLNIPLDAGADEIIMGTATFKPSGVFSRAIIGT